MYKYNIFNIFLKFIIDDVQTKIKFIVYERQVNLINIQQNQKR